MRQTIKHVAVVIPARNEEKLLPRCLRSVLAACDALPATVTHDIVVVVDASTDRSLEISMLLLGDRGMTFSVNFEAVGRVRHTGALEAITRSPESHFACWLANTDADCEVPPDWLTRQLELSASGAEAIAGIVDVDSFEDHLPVVGHRFRTSYLIHPDGSHPHVHGANLGVKTDAYLKAGGWSAMATAEDHDLWQRLSACGCSLRSVADLKVLTSGRRLGRAPDGFAAALTRHERSVA